MQSATVTGLEDAIQAHLTDTQGETLDGYVLVAVGTSVDLLERGATGYHLILPESQPQHVTAGLIAMLADGWFDPDPEGD